MFSENHNIYSNPYDEDVLNEDESYLYDAHGCVWFCSYVDNFFRDVIRIRVDCLKSHENNMLTKSGVRQSPTNSLDPTIELAANTDFSRSAKSEVPPKHLSSRPGPEIGLSLAARIDTPEKDGLKLADTRIDIPQLKEWGIVPYALLNDSCPKRTLDDGEKIRLSNQWYDLAHWAKSRSFPRKVIFACYNHAIDLLSSNPIQGSPTNLRAIQIMIEKWFYLASSGTEKDFKPAIGQLELMKKPLEELQEYFMEDSQHNSNALRKVLGLLWTVSRYMGDLYYKWDRSNGAIKHYEDVLRTFRILGTGHEKNMDSLYSDVCHVYYDIADVHLNRCSNYPAAMMNVTQALFYWDSITLPTNNMMEQKARLLFLKSQILVKQMEHTKALEVMNQAFKIQESLVNIDPIAYTEALLMFCEKRMEHNAFCRKFAQARTFHNQKFSYYCQYLDARRQELSCETSSKPLDRNVSIQVSHDNLWCGNEGRKWGQLLQNRGNTGLAVRIFFRALCFYRSEFDLSPYKYADNRYFLAEVLDLTLAMVRLLHDVGLCFTAESICQHLAGFFENLPKTINGLPSKYKARFLLDYGQVCFSLHDLPRAHDFFDQSVNTWEKLADTPEPWYDVYHAIALRQRAIVSNMLNNEGSSASITQSDSVRNDLVTSINAFFVTNIVSVEHFKESMKSVRTYAKLLLEGPYITLTDEVLANTFVLLENFNIPHPENDEENMGEPQLTRTWTVPEDASQADSADLERIKKCEKDWYRVVLCFEALLNNIAIGEVQLLEPCYDACRDMLSIKAMQNVGLDLNFYNAVRNSLLRSQEEYNPQRDPVTLLNKTDSVARGFKNILPGVVERIMFPVDINHVHILCQSTWLSTGNNKVLLSDEKTTLPTEAAEALLKTRRIIYERFRCVILCLDAYVWNTLSNTNNKRKLDFTPPANPRDDIEELILMIIETCDKAYELVEWHLTELITAYLRCCPQPDELGPACNKVLDWIEKLTPEKSGKDRFAVRHMICKIFARVNDIMIKALENPPHKGSDSPDFLAHVDHLFVSARSWYRSNDEPEDVPLLADFVRLAFEQIMCADKHHELSESVESLSDLDQIAKKMARHGHSDCKEISAKLNALRESKVACQ